MLKRRALRASMASSISAALTTSAIVQYATRASVVACHVPNTDGCTAPCGWVQVDHVSAIGATAGKHCNTL